MDYHCLSREEYKDLILHVLNSVDVDNEDLNVIIERAKNDWDINIVGSNYFLSKILEQLMKKVDISDEIISNIYNVKDLMFFSVDELNYRLVENLFLNHLPEKYNTYSINLDEARKVKDEKNILFYEEKLSTAFEEDFLNVIESYYESEIHH